MGGILNYGWLDRPLSIAGRVIYKEKDTTTDSVSSTIFKEICKMANIPYQNYSSHNDMATGSTLAGLCIRHVSVDSIDVGIPQLAMHSANEIVGSDDTFSLYKTFKKFYDVSIERNKDSFLIKEKGNE